LTRIRAMTVDDLDFAVEITHQEGWGYTRDDLKRILEWSPDGCIVIEDDGKRIGMATSLNYGGFGWVGNVVVRKDHRGLGHGKAIMRHIISEMMGQGAHGVRLFAYENTTSFYETMGFRHEGPVRVMRRHPELATEPMLPTGYDVSPVKEDELPAIIDMDRDAFGGDRGKVLRTIWEANPGLVLALRKEGETVAFLAAKKVLGNIEIGPWVTSRSDARPALHLLDSLLHLSNCHIYIATSEARAGTIKALEERAFQQIDTVYAMSIGRPPQMRDERLLSVGALEKG
jgi:predicted N-acetyltransferase YhbS